MPIYSMFGILSIKIDDNIFITFLVLFIKINDPKEYYSDHNIFYVLPFSVIHVEILVTNRST